MTLREEMIRSEYSKLYPPLEEEENQYMACMKNQSNTILEELKKSEAMMVHKRSQLIEMYQELIAMSQKPYEVLLLQVSMEECLKQIDYLRPTSMTVTFEIPFYIPCTYYQVLRKIWRDNFCNNLKRASLLTLCQQIPYGISHLFVFVACVFETPN